MAEINLPLRISYQTKGITPLEDVIAALQAADVVIRESVSLLPSFIDGVRVESSRINVRSLSQESPLRELFLVSLIVGFQDDLEAEIPPMIERLFDTNIPETYDTVLTVVVMMVVFYGLAFVKDAATRALSTGPIREQFDAIVRQTATSTGKSEDEVRKILDAKFAKPSAVKRLAKAAQNLFRPSQKEGAVPVVFDRQVVDERTVREIPYFRETDDDKAFERYRSHQGVRLEIHAQDRDKLATGWAAVPLGISERRLRLKIMPPLTAVDLWNRNVIEGDVTIVSEMTSDGFTPTEIHLTRIAG